jgi:hypothetical protein
MNITEYGIDHLSKMCPYLMNIQYLGGNIYERSLVTGLLEKSLHFMD